MMAKKEEDRKKIFQKIEPLLVDGAKIEVIDTRKSKSNIEPLMVSQVKGGKVLTSILKGDQIPLWKVSEGTESSGFSGVLDMIYNTTGGSLVLGAVLAAPKEQITPDLLSRIVANLSEVFKSETDIFSDDDTEIDTGDLVGPPESKAQETNRIGGVDLSASRQFAKQDQDGFENIRFVFPSSFFSDAKFKPADGTDVVMKFSKHPSANFKEIRKNFLNIGTYDAKHSTSGQEFLVSKNAILGSTMSAKINVSVITREPVELVAKHLAALVLSERYAVEINGQRIDL
jgi:hypothetical protein